MGVPAQEERIRPLSNLYVDSLVAQMVKNLPAICETRVWSLSRKDPLEMGMTTHPNILAGEFHGQRSWWPTFPGVTKTQRQLSD